MYVLNILKVFCEEALSQRKTPPTPIRAKVENALVWALPKGSATVSNIARALAMSARSLARRLNEESTSYTEVLDSVRRELATRYLEDKTFSISQIAWLLGYSEVSSFNHAFRRLDIQRARGLCEAVTALAKAGHGAKELARKSKTFGVSEARSPLLLCSSSASAHRRPRLSYLPRTATGRKRQCYKAKRCNSIRLLATDYRRETGLSIRDSTELASDFTKTPYRGHFWRGDRSPTPTE